MGENELDIRIIEVINQLEDLIDESPRPKFGGVEKRIVDIEEIRDILGDMKVVIPEDIRRANSVLSQAEKTVASADSYAERTKGVADDNARLIMRKAESESSIMLEKARNDAEEIVSNATSRATAMLREAKAKAEAIMEEAVRERNAMLDESDVMKEANRRAEILRAKAEYRANEIFDNAKIYADNILADISGYLGKYIEMVEGNRDALEVRDMQIPANRPEQRVQTLEDPINQIISEQEQAGLSENEPPVEEEAVEEPIRLPVDTSSVKAIEPRITMPRSTNEDREEFPDDDDDDEDEDDEDDGHRLFSFFKSRRRKRNEMELDDDDDE